LGIGDWGLGIGVLGVWVVGARPKNQKQKPQTPNTKKKNY